ncbi:cytochrome c [Stenotrophomonas mori]|uniref:Cytochrome c n=1 Tax=Stenotrophomonas mori TaxID=2871096 RepID=A0ABT0SER0_9GAMM|nr:cytochrome c [Stenotrophomonas mori]MCL7713805.1 cytochrome c [Stenotrophomonas mori]
MTETTRKPSNAYRYLFVLIFGLVIGVVASVMLASAIKKRQDPFPGSLMQVMAKQSQLLEQSRKQSRCSINDTAPRLQTLRALSNDLDLAFPGLRDDARFQQHASRFRASLNDALGTPPSDCTALAIVTERIGNDCKACHQDFR